MFFDDTLSPRRNLEVEHKLANLSLKIGILTNTLQVIFVLLFMDMFQEL